MKLGLDGSIIVPDGIIAIQPAISCFVDRWTRLAPYWPSLIEELGQADKTEQNKLVSSFSAHHSSTGGLGASSSVACLFPKAPSGKYSDHRIFNFQDPVWGSFTPSLLSRVRKGVENQKFIFLLLSAAQNTRQQFRCFSAQSTYRLKTSSGYPSLLAQIV